MAPNRPVALRTAVVLVLLGAMVAVPAVYSTGSDQPAVAATSEDPADTALRHVREHSAQYGLNRSDVSDAVVTDSYRDEHNGVAHVYLLQRHNGLEIRNATMTVNVASDGEIVDANSRFVGGLGATAQSVQPARSAAESAESAAKQLGLEPSEDIEPLASARGTQRRVQLSDGGVSRRPIPAKLVYQPLDDGLRLAWNVKIDQLHNDHFWDATVDAETGELLSSADYVDDNSTETAGTAVDGSREASTQSDGGPRAAVRPPDPVKDGSLYRVHHVHPESPNDGPRTVRHNPADALGSPFGWHDTDSASGAEFTATRGNNAHAYTDHDDDGEPDPGSSPDGGQRLQFLHPNEFGIDLSEHPHEYAAGAVTNLFYWNNVIHDLTYRYGFTEAAGNFQVNNYGRGGTGGDDVRAEAQDGGGLNNANFFTPGDGDRPRMQMYLWDPPSELPDSTPMRDGDLDAGVITHEYGHGVSNRLTGGPSNVRCLHNEEQMGEGWSDWLAMAFTAQRSDAGPAPRGIGTYVLYQDSRYNQGIRSTAYSTDMSINPTTYGDIDSLRIPHGVGYAWATMLWEVYWNLVDEHGFNPNVYGDWHSGGNNRAIQLVMDGMKFQPCEPGFVDGRDAILTADEELTGGENQCAIWEAFAKRGLGYSARQGSSDSAQDGEEAFDTHPRCE